MRVNRELRAIKHNEVRAVRSRLRYLIVLVKRDDPSMKQVPVLVEMRNRVLITSICRVSDTPVTVYAHGPHVHLFIVMSVSKIFTYNETSAFRPRRTLNFTCALRGSSTETRDIWFTSSLRTRDNLTCWLLPSILQRNTN